MATCMRASARVCVKSPVQQMDPHSMGEDTARVLMGPDVGAGDESEIDERRRVERRGHNVGEGGRVGEVDKETGGQSETWAELDTGGAE